MPKTLHLGWWTWKGLQHTRHLFFIFIFTLGSPTIHTPPRDATVNENGNVTLYCYAAGCPSPNITWKKHGDNSFTSSGNMLMLTSVKREHAGTYICEASNMKGTPRENATLTVYCKYCIVSIIYYCCHTWSCFSSRLDVVSFLLRV